MQTAYRHPVNHYKSGLRFIDVQNDAKNAFKELLASVNCSSDWSWEQALKLIVNDARWAFIMSTSGCVLCKT